MVVVLFFYYGVLVCGVCWFYFDVVVVYELG